MRNRSRLVYLVLSVLLLWWMRPAAQTRTAGLDQAPEPSEGPGVVVFDLLDDSSAESIAAFERRHGVDLEYSSEVSQDEALLFATVDDPAAVLAATASDPLVEVAEVAIDFTISAYPDDPMWDKQWNMALIGVPAGWRVGGGRNVRVAVIDTGVTPVEDLSAYQLAGGRSFVPGTRSPADDHGHGTHVAGTIAQATHNGLGVAGVAPNALIVPYKVLTASGIGRSDWIAAAIDAAVDDGADVINMSLGGPTSKVLKKAAEAAAERGVVVVAAAGNNGRRGVSCPANGEGVIGVSSVGPDDALAFYSSWGPGVEIAGPGGNLRLEGGGVVQDTIDGQGGHAYRAFQGTSMAAPHVAGAAAVLVGMGLTGPQATDALLASATTRDEKDATERFGHGRLDLEAAVRSVLVRQRGLLFGIGGLMAAFVAGMATLRRSARLSMVVAGAASAGGLFFLPLLPLDPSIWVELGGSGLVFWPAVLFDPDWVHFPLWTSALVPAGLAFVFGPSRQLGPVVAGLCVGFGASLLYGAVAGTLDPWWLGLGLDRLWLSLNGTACLIMAMAVVGLQSLGRNGDAS